MQALSEAIAEGFGPEMWGLAGVVLGAVLGGGAQIVTVILTHRHAVQQEHTKFKRDAYFEALERAEALVEATQESFRRSPSSDFERYREALGVEMRALRAFEDSQLALEMYAPPRVTLAVQALLDAVQATRAQTSAEFPPRANTAMGAYEAAHDVAVITMRLDLQVDRRGFWRRQLDRVLRKTPPRHTAKLRPPEGHSPTHGDN